MLCTGKNISSYKAPVTLSHIQGSANSGAPGRCRISCSLNWPKAIVHLLLQRRKDCVLSRAIPVISYSPKKCLHALRRASFLASLTAEAAIELPIFFLCIVIVLNYTAVFRTAGEFSNSLTQTAEEMAIVAYKDSYSDANQIIRGAISDTYAHAKVIDTISDPSSVKLASFINSSYMREGDRIRLVLTYQPRAKFSLIPLPLTFFVQKAVIRGWTGRLGPGEAQADGSASGQKVYVTEYGTVYHTDPNCTHINLTIMQVSKSELKRARNLSGGKYKHCKYCGRGHGDCYYIDPYGDRYHTSLDCPGLTRTVSEVDIHDCAGMTECADCKKRRGG